MMQRPVPETLLSSAARANLAADLSLGAGNFVHRALAASPAPDAAVLELERPYTPFWGEPISSLSLAGLAKAARRYAAWYAAQGVKRMDPVAVYLDDGVEYLIHYTALTGLGAIPILTNGNMPPAIAAGHFARCGAVGLFTDKEHLALLPEVPGFVATEATLRGFVGSEVPVYYPYEHAAEDPVMIAHSSGTTGIPKPVLLQHQRYFYGVRYRLALPAVPGGERILSSLPHSHNAAIAYIMLALLGGTPVRISSDHGGASILRQIATFRPSMVVSFPQTYVEMCEHDLDRHDLSSVRLFFNGGDAAHELHIRKLVKYGARFVDGLGSSEMGFSLFRHVHDKASDVFGRCVGTPLEWVDAAVFSETGEKLAAHRVGRLAVKAPSVTSGYWNDSVLTYKSQVQGYFLTGDLVYFDDEGRFFHVDRVPDRVMTRNGPLYSLQTEELLMRHHPGLLDCSVVAATSDDGSQSALALVRLRSGEAGTDESLLHDFNGALRGANLLPLAAVRLAKSADIPLGATGKVLKRELRERASQILGGNA